MTVRKPSRRDRAYLNFTAFPHAMKLRNGVRYHNGFERRFLDAVQSGSGEDTMRGDGVNFICSSFQKSEEKKKFLTFQESPSVV
jgi:hypothetical protein